jgi:hypothetical protein
MRFITEFELKFPYQLSVLETYKVRNHLDIGNQIGESFEWKDEFDDDANRYKLEIEAFPMDKWVEFKKRLAEACNMSYPNGTTILWLLSELESFGKPAGEKI